MKSVIVASLVACLSTGMAIAQDLGNSRELPVKNTPVVTYEPPAVPRQGGDTIEDATVIPGLPYSDSGTTEGYIDNYDEVCPYTGSTSPDVVYSFTPDSNVQVRVDLCGSGYDTKLYIYGTDLNLIACNDDAYYGDECGNYVSAIEEALLFGGETYYIVIDGYGGESGVYKIDVKEFEPCIFVGCPWDAVPEGEPPLHDGYVDLYNGGCESPDPYDHFQAIEWINQAPGNPLDGRAWMCGQSGWFLSEDGSSARDTDWFVAFASVDGVMEFTVESEYPMYMYKLVVQDCATVEVDHSAIAECGATTTLAFPVLAGEEIWLWTGPTTFEGPVPEFSYFMTVSNVYSGGCIPIEAMSWGQVKSLYR